MRLSDLPAVPGVRHRDVAAGSVRLHVAEAGKGPPLVLLHGWPQHWWCWRHLIPRLAEDHRVLAPDLRGWGWSDAPPGDYAKSTFAADVLALEHPERIERMVALDIAPPWMGPPQLRHVALPLLASYQLLVGTPVLGPRALT